MIRTSATLPVVAPVSDTWIRVTSSHFDKNNTSLITRKPEYLAGVCLGKLLHDALDGGMLSLRADPQGKTMGTALLRIEIDTEDTQ